MLAGAGKMRLDDPDYVFVLGLAEGEFPTAPGESGLLTHADRDALMANEIDLPDCFENRVVREQVCFYKALTAPAKGLWMSWPKGQGLTLCAALEPIVDALDPAPPELELADLAATPADGLDCLGGGWSLTEVERASLTEALKTPGTGPEETEEPQGLALLRRMAESAPRQVHDLTALEALFAQPAGKILYLPLRLFPAIRFRPAPPQAGRAFRRPERHPDALGAADGAGPEPRPGQPLRQRHDAFFGAGRRGHGGAGLPAGGRVRQALSAGGHRPLCLPALPPEKEHDKPFVLPAG